MEKYRVVFIGGFRHSTNSELYNKVDGCYFSSDPFQISLLKGFSLLGNKLLVLNMPFFPKNSTQFMVPLCECDEEYGHLVNLPFRRKKYIEYQDKYRNVYNYLKKNQSEPLVILVYSSFQPFLKAAIKFKKKSLKPVKIINIVPDLPKFTGIYVKRNIIKKIWSSIRNKMYFRSTKHLDGFIFFAEGMNRIINKANKPHIVLEGIADCNYKYLNQYKETTPRVILYSGSLQYRYGLRMLIDVIGDFKQENVEFHFYGSGEAENELKLLSSKTSKVKFFGVVDRAKLNSAQQKAFALVNPRNSKEAFTEFSFPSKNLEYLLSGRPVICYKLKGVPDEYDNFFIYAKGDSKNDLATCIKSVLSLSAQEADAIGEKGRNFVLNNKMPYSQALKAARLINELGEKIC